MTAGYVFWPRAIHGPHSLSLSVFGGLYLCYAFYLLIMASYLQENGHWHTSGLRAIKKWPPNRCWHRNGWTSTRKWPPVYFRRLEPLENGHRSSSGERNYRKMAAIYQLINKKKETMHPATILLSQRLGILGIWRWRCIKQQWFNLMSPNYKMRCLSAAT